MHVKLLDVSYFIFRIISLIDNTPWYPSEAAIATSSNLSDIVIIFNVFLSTLSDKIYILPEMEPKLFDTIYKLPLIELTFVSIVLTLCLVSNLLPIESTTSFL